MIIVKVILCDKKYRLPDAEAEKEFPVLFYLQKGLTTVFEKVTREFPNDAINVTWNEDVRKLTYSSKTVPKRIIYAILYSEFGTLFD
jgi:hypothetical protein